MKPQILDVDWTSLEEATSQTALVVRGKTTPPSIFLDEHNPATVRLQRREHPEPGAQRWFHRFVALLVAWCILAAVLLAAGALTPVEGNVLTYIVGMSGLYIAAFIGLTRPLPSKTGGRDQ